MKKIFLPLLATIFLIVSCSKDNTTDNPHPKPEEPMPVAISGRNVVAYVTNYSSSIPDTKYITHICYAFAELYVQNGVYKGFKIQGEESRFKSITNLKKTNPSLKISLSFTHLVSNNGNSQGGGFSALASNEQYRKAFAEDCKNFLITWGIDGVDIDWEYPGISWSGHASNPLIDVENHKLLMKQLRETLGSGYIISYAGYVKDKQVTAGGSKYIDIKGVDPYVDFVNIMTYDMDAAPHHHSALRDVSAFCDCYSAVHAYLSAGVSPSKLVLGVPFYGRHSFSQAPTAITYKKILTLGNEYKIDNWDNSASVPYVTKNGMYFCGYDNDKSIAIKGEWLLSQGMKGMMYWNYDGDDGKGTLRNAVWRAVMKK